MVKSSGRLRESLLDIESNDFVLMIIIDEGSAGGANPLLQSEVLRSCRSCRKRCVVLDSHSQVIIISSSKWGRCHESERTEKDETSEDKGWL
jgi:hypothetical protein